MANKKISQLDETLTILPGDIFPVVVNPLTIPKTKKITYDNLRADILNAVDHGSISGLGDDDHTQYFNTTRHTLLVHTNLGLVPNTRQIISGNGISGGGDLSADRTLAIGAGTGITVGADNVGINLAANLTWTGLHTFQSYLTTRDIYPESTDTYDLGSSTKLWRKGYLSEMEALLFVENSISVIGGWFLITKNQGTLPSDINDSQTTIDFGKTLIPNDFVVIRTSLQLEYIQVGTLVSGTTYNVTRNLDGSGANSWPAGTVFAVLGYSGDGRIELNASDTPRIQLIQQGATYNIQSEIIRIGDLNGNWGYLSETWGAAIGEYAVGKSSVIIDETGVLSIRNYQTERIKLTSAGILTLNDSGGNAVFTFDAALGAEFTKPLTLATTGGIYQGTGSFATPTTGLKMWNDAGIGRIGGYNAGNLQWHGSTDGKLYAGSNTVVLDSNGISIATGSAYWDITHELSFLSGTTKVGAIGHYYDSLTAGYYMYLEVPVVANRASFVDIDANAYTGKVARAHIGADSNGLGGGMTLYGLNTYSYITLGGGVKVGAVVAGSPAWYYSGYMEVERRVAISYGGSETLPCFAYQYSAAAFDTGLYFPSGVSGTQLAVTNDGVTTAIFKTTGLELQANKNFMKVQDGTVRTGSIFVPLTTPLTSTSWDGTRNKSTGSGSINVNTTFGVPSGAKAVLVRMTSYDSGTFTVASNIRTCVGSSSTYYYTLTNYLYTNDWHSSSIGIVPISSDLLYYNNRASGTNTLVCELTIWGYFI